MKYNRILVALVAFLLLLAGNVSLSADSMVDRSYAFDILADNDSTDLLITDSIPADTTKKSGGDVLDAPVKYIANDSMVWSRVYYRFFLRILIPPR